MDCNKTKHLIGVDYFLSIFHNYRYGNLIKGLLYFNSERISKETTLERLFWDISEFIEDTNIIEVICSKIENEVTFLKNLNNKEVGNPPPKIDNFGKKIDSQEPIFQYDYTFFDLGKFEFDTLSMNLREGIRNYRGEVYGLLKVKNYYFHDFMVNYYFFDGYLGILKKAIKLTKFDFITLRFCKEKLTLTLKRSINKRISCEGFVLDILKDFIGIGIKELNIILDNYGIDKEEFERNIRAKNYTRLHLAKDINRNIKTEQPELYNRLRLNQNNDMESLDYIGLEYWYHYIDLSKKDKHGYNIPEYEIQFRKGSGISFNELERNLLLLEPNIFPKQETIYQYLDKDYTCYKAITEFSIRKNPPISSFLLEYKPDYKINDFYNLEKIFYIQLNWIFLRLT